MALHIPLIPLSPVTLSTSVATSKVAIAIPETGLLLLPTSPTILEETVAKKKPKTTIIAAPKSETGIAGINQMRSVKTAMAITINTILRSREVRSSEPTFEPLKLLTAPLKVLTIIGSDLIRLIIPPAVNAPAPM